MPLYEFQCADCQDDFEELVRSSVAIPEVKCPECGSDHVLRKISVFASKSSGGPSFAAAPAAASCAPGGT
jgi:putative FmdB family regulatory protein